MYLQALFYHISLKLYYLAVLLASVRSTKARKWLAGRKNWRHVLRHSCSGYENVIWMHCSSLGEFEQGRPLLERLKIENPGIKVVLTFFSPSGYDSCKNYKGADFVCYLPLDGPKAARDFILLIRPRMAIFVKYEFWYYYLKALKDNDIPTIIISSAFRAQQVFFRWYGGLFRKMLGYFSQIHVQDAQSAQLLNSIGITDNVHISGDTRYDRVAAIRKGLKAIPVADVFKSGTEVLVAGSTWPDDERILKACFDVLPAHWKMIIAPHEIHKEHIQQIQGLFGDDCVLFSNFNVENVGNERILIIDNIGMLSSLYAYGNIAFIGGGFNRGGIHNTLEPAIFGLPVVMGPVYEKFVEAVELVAAGVAFPVSDADNACKTIARLAAEPDTRARLHSTMQDFMQQHEGAAGRIVKKMQEAGWL